MKKKKKQHTVPQGYLEAWAISNTHQIHVFDKVKFEKRINNISEVPTERFFYDVDFSCTLNKEQISECISNGFDPSKIDDDQYIENFFANEIEGEFKNILTRIIKRVNSMNVWEFDNCFFVNDEIKVRLSFLLTFQFFRVKRVRNSILESANRLTQFLSDMEIDEEIINRYTINKKQAALIHGNMIMNPNHIEEMAKGIFSLTWILLVNETEELLYTSDTPIGTYGHIKHPFLPLNGIMTKGVEVFFPISPKLLLLMVDGDWHKSFARDDKRIKVIDDVNIVKHYNHLCVAYAERLIFSSNGDFSFVDYLSENYPDSFKTTYS